jgi:hypothetical protein
MNTLALILTALLAAGCPFCTAVKPTLAQQREAADVVLIAEVDSITDNSFAVLRIHQIIKGKGQLSDASMLRTRLNFKPAMGSLLVCFATRDGNELQWTATAVNETSLAYFAGAPELRETASKRLGYFARFLEHPDAMVAEDAYLEFGHAPYDMVGQAADALSMAKLREWLASERVPEVRKGFYAVALGLAKTAEDRRANTALLRKLITAEDDDFRAGFDGMLAGYLLLDGKKALDLIDQRFLMNPKAAEGNVRHALTALRFYAESGSEISHAELSKALRHLLRRPEFADRVIIDLARLQDWSNVSEIAALYSTGAERRSLRQAVVGYLKACPTKQASKELAKLQAKDPQGVAAALETLTKLDGAAQ